MAKTGFFVGFLLYHRYNFYLFLEAFKKRSIWEIPKTMSAKSSRYRHKMTALRNPLFCAESLLFTGKPRLICLSPAHSARYNSRFCCTFQLEKN